MTEEEFIKNIKKPDRKRMLTRIEQTGIEKVKFGKMNTPAMKKFTEKLKKLGFKYVAVDLQGFRSGSLNESITK